MHLQRAECAEAVAVPCLSEPLQDQRDSVQYPVRALVCPPSFLLSPQKNGCIVGMQPDVVCILIPLDSRGHVLNVVRDQHGLRYPHYRRFPLKRDFQSYAGKRA